MRGTDCQAQPLLARIQGYCEEKVMFRYAVTAIVGLLASLGGTAALADRGDLDIGYGAGGRLTAGTIFFDPAVRPASDLVALNLPDDRLITVEGTLVRRFDSQGQPDLTFGRNGETNFALPAATPFITLLLNPVSTPDGGLLLATYLRDDLETTHFQALIRLDQDGQLVTSFGGNGDGVYRLTTDGGLMAVAVDPTGRVLLAKRGPGVANHPCSGARFVERLTPDGSIDTTFGVNGRSDVTGIELCRALLFRARDDGGFLVGGRRTVIAFDSSGTPDPSYGEQGLLALDPSVEWWSGLLLPGGGLMLAGAPPSQSGIALARFNASGQPDVLFGDGTGAVQRDFGEAFFGISGLQHHVSALESTVDGGQLYLQVSLMRPDRGVVCAGGIARLSGDGSIDASFGQRGFTCLDYGAFPFAFIGLQRNGAPLFGRLDGNVHRLLLDETASPGFLAIARPANWHDVGEKDGSATLAVVRTAGRDGVVSAHFYTREAPPDTRHTPPSTDHIAGADSDYRTASGRVEWVDGEESWQFVSIDILDDLDEEIREVFLVEFDDAQGGTELYGSGQFVVGINDDDRVVIDDDDSGAQADDSQSGGGGASTWATLVALLTFLFLRRRLAFHRSAIVAF
jgi:uncharacterized delta-60 repeat protein